MLGVGYLIIVLSLQHSSKQRNRLNYAKSEGELVVSGTVGYVYVPAPWWKMDYFEIRYENPADNRRYFYQVDGEGIRYELVALAKAVREGRNDYYIEESVTDGIARIMEEFTSIYGNKEENNNEKFQKIIELFPCCCNGCFSSFCHGFCLYSRFRS